MADTTDLTESQQRMKSKIIGFYDTALDRLYGRIDTDRKVLDLTDEEVEDLLRITTSDDVAEGWIEWTQDGDS